MLIKHTIDTPCKITARKTKPEFECSRCGRTDHANNSGSRFNLISHTDWEMHKCIDPEVKPVQQPLRKISVALEDKVAANLKDALNRDIIEEVKGPK